MDLSQPFRLLWGRLSQQGLGPTFWWAADHAVRATTGAPLRRVSEIQPGLHVGGQHRRRGWQRMLARGITAVVNMRIEYDDEKEGVASDRYLHLPTVDDHAPSLDHLRQGAAFIAKSLASGGGVYVHCGSGVGRAATMAAAYLVSTGMTVEESWAHIRKARPFIRPTAVQIAQLERFAESLA